MDAECRRHPTALNKIHFDLEGPAEWRGGIAKGPDNYILSQSLPVEGGVNRVLVRSETEAGKIRLMARADGLESAELEFESVPFETTNGWSRQLPAENLPSNLERGPTPDGPAYTVKRIPVEIVDATAGFVADRVDIANARYYLGLPETAGPEQSFDDDETTAWTSSNRIEDAWIEYHLERPAEMMETTMKLSGFRERSSPLRILVDGEEAWRGRTPRSLGYVTLEFDKPHNGQTVRIEMLGAVTDEDAFDITELDEVANAATGADGLSESVLSIVEIEFYEAVE